MPELPAGREPLPPAPCAGSAPAEALARDLRRADFTVPALADLLGPVATGALDREQRLPALDVARRQASPAATLLRLFALGDAVGVAELDRALPSLGLDGATRLNLVRAAGQQPGDEVRAVIDLRPIDLARGSVWIASDLGEAATGAPIHPDHVLGVGAAGLTLAELTVPTPAHAALDLGTGCGIQALNLAPNAHRILGTDTSQRALRFAAFNARLNETELDLGSGDMLSAVDGGRFDLIVSNPPFVITPRTGSEPLTYRDAGRAGDDLIAALTREIPRHLAPGGVAQFLANWEIPRGQRWSGRIESWTRETDVDVWVIQRELTDPAHYAETWLRDGGLSQERDRDAWERGYREYLNDFAGRDVEAIGFGYVTMRRPLRQRAPWRRFEELTGPVAGGIGTAVAHALSVIDQPPELGTARLIVDPSVTEERHYLPGESDPRVIQLRQGGGLQRTARVSSHVAATVGACDGDLTLRQITAALAQLSGQSEGQVIDDVHPAIADLLIDGFLRAHEGDR